MSFDQSHPIFALSDGLVDELCALFPNNATYLGVAGYDDRWPDLSPAGVATTLAALKEMRAKVEALPPGENEWDELAVAVAVDELDRMINTTENDAHLRNLNSIASPIQELRETFDHMAKDTREEWENIIVRLEGLGTVLEGYVASLEEGRTRGMAVAGRQVVEAARQADVTASDASAFMMLLREYDDATVGDDDQEQRLAAAIQAGRMAYADLATYLRTTYAPSARTEDAVGAERYRREAHSMLGMDLDPEEAYAWGWDEVAALRSRMEDVAAQIAPGGGIAEALERLKTDPAKSAATPEEFVSIMSERIDEALTRLADTQFDVPEPIRRCDVKLAPPGGTLGAYYVGPSEDFARPGSVWWSIERDKPKPLYDEVSTAYHEGFPGHHLQVGIQVSLRERLSRLHRLWVWMAGSGEGWALYSERLMDELGYLDTPDYVFGYLAGQILRACRVVIDIGSHLELPIPEGQAFHPGEVWTYQTAVEMLEEYATLDRAYAESEVNRYYGWPGQAIAYKLGEREILRLRDEIAARDGEAFDVKAFHERLLEVGPVGLELLRRSVLSG